jgi:hypothetical protein
MIWRKEKLKKLNTIEACMKGRMAIRDLFSLAHAEHAPTRRVGWPGNRERKDDAGQMAHRD